MVTTVTIIAQYNDTTRTTTHRRQNHDAGDDVLADSTVNYSSCTKNRRSDVYCRASKTICKATSYEDDRRQERPDPKSSSSIDAQKQYTINNVLFPIYHRCPPARTSMQHTEMIAYLHCTFFISHQTPSTWSS